MTTQTVCVLGRQPALGIAELESLYGAEHIRPLGRQAALLTLEPASIDFSRLGGTVKFCKLLTILETTSWPAIQKFLQTSVPQHVGYLPEGKMKLGLSAYDLGLSVRQINATGLALKKIIQTTGRSVRVIPNSELALNSAQVLHNKLTSALGWELVFIRDGRQTLVAQNIAEQDITAYAARDQARPKRDAKVGMLPPKLAQIVINLAVGKAEPVDPTCGPHDPKHKTLLDPFCGTGVIMKEAKRMGYPVVDRAREPRMVDYSQQNLAWLAERYNLKLLTYNLEVGDATQHKWNRQFQALASEAYLGRPFSALPKPDVLQAVMQDVDTILKKFLQNLAKQTKPGFRLCLALPAWKTPRGFKHLPTLDKLAQLGYNRVSFKHASNDELIYHREGQIVARELIVLTRK